MKHASRIAMAIALTLGMAWWSGVGRAQQQEGVGEKVQKTFDEAGRKLKKGINKAEDAVREGYHKTREAVHSMGVHGRVYGRLHWDKALNGSEFHVKAEGGVVTLTGSVASADARTKAVTLAAETVGVTKVVDELTVKATPAKAAVRKR